MHYVCDFSHFFSENLKPIRLKFYKSFFMTMRCWISKIMSFVCMMNYLNWQLVISYAWFMRIFEFGPNIHFLIKNFNSTPIFYPYIFLLEIFFPRSIDTLTKCCNKYNYPMSIVYLSCLFFESIPCTLLDLNSDDVFSVEIL